MSVHPSRHEPVSAKTIFACPCGSLKIAFQYTHMICTSCHRASRAIDPKVVLDDPWMVVDLWNTYAISAYPRPRAVKERHAKSQAKTP